VIIEGCTAVIQSGQETTENLISTLNNRGNAYWANQEVGRAMQDYDQAIRVKPNDAGALGNRGNAHLTEGDYDRAIQDFDQMLRLQPNRFGALSGRDVVCGQVRGKVRSELRRVICNGRC
jgi:tetratricopeptide (TPR) repeat protein